MKDDAYWMQKALAYAQQAHDLGEVPVGAVMVDAKNHLIGYGLNKVITENDPTAHAEMIAIRQAAQYKRNMRLTDCTLYVTLEPCCMCAGALVHARVKRLVFATRDVKAGASGSVFNLLKGYPLNHQVHIDEGIWQQPCAAVLREFFKSRR